MSRVRSNFITNRLADGAPTASLGLIISGVTTSTTLNVDDKIVHTGDTNTAIRFPATDTITAETAGSERIRITSTGLVGIGTDTPAQPVHISRGSAVARIQSTDASTSARLEIIAPNDSYSGLHLGDVDDVDVGAIRYYHAGSDPNHMSFRTSGSEKVRITSDGKVGINTDNPSRLLEINTTGTSTEGIVLKSNDSTYPKLQFGANRTNADAFLGLIIASWDGTDVASMHFETGSDTTNKDDGLISFRTAASGGTREERLRIASDGVITGRGELRLTEGTTDVSQGAEIGSLMFLNPFNDNKNAKIAALRTTGTSGADLAFYTRTHGDGTNDDGGIERLRIGSTGYISGNINIPAWFGRQDAAHNVTTGTWTAIINLGNDVVNPSMNNGGWDESTGTFTVQAGQAGTYYVFGQAGIDDIQSDDIVRVGISKNDGTPGYFGEQRAHAGEANQIYQAYVARVLSVAVGDTIKLKVYHNESTTEPTEPNRCYFGGYRIAV